MTSNIIFIAGATASGKSGLALRLAKILGGTIINADSMQVYNGLRLLSARPSEKEQEGIAHALYGFLAPHENYSAAQWHDDAMAEITKAKSVGSTPILVGGTGLYFKALLDGLTEIPEIDSEIRENIRKLVQDKGAKHVHGLLAREDPIMAEELDEADGQRLARALEVVRSTGTSLQTWQNMPTKGGLSEADARGEVIKLVVERPREETYARIDKRLLEMLDQGALNEVSQLKKLNLPDESLVLKALGVSSFMKHLNGTATLDEALSEAQTLTRRYAKRQMTWLRNQFNSWQRISPDEIENMLEDEILGILNNERIKR